MKNRECDIETLQKARKIIKRYTRVINTRFLFTINKYSENYVEWKSYQKRQSKAEVVRASVFNYMQNDYKEFKKYENKVIIAIKEIALILKNLQK